MVFDILIDNRLALAISYLSIYYDDLLIYDTSSNSIITLFKYSLKSFNLRFEASIIISKNFNFEDVREDEVFLNQNHSHYYCNISCFDDLVLMM